MRKMAKTCTKVLSLLLVGLFALLLISNNVYASTVEAFSYNGKSLNYSVGDDQVVIENYIKDHIVIIDGDFAASDILLTFSAGAFDAEGLKAGTHTVILTATKGEKVAVPIILDVFAINDFIDFKGDVTSVTDYAFSTGIAPVNGDPQPNTIEAWINLPSAQISTGAKGTELGYIVGSGAGGSGPNIFSIAVYGTGSWGFYWNNKIYPTISSPGTTGGISTVPTLVIPYDTWTHVAAVRDKDAQVIRFYMNGELIYTTDVTAGIGTDLIYDSAPASTKTIGVGKDGRTARNRRLGASLATVSIFGSVRTQEEIKADMKASLGGAWDLGADRWLHYDFSDQSLDFITEIQNLEVTEGASVDDLNAQILAGVSVKDGIGRNVTPTISFSENIVDTGVFKIGNGVITLNATDLFGNTESYEIGITVSAVPVPTLTYTGSDINDLTGKTKQALETEILSKVIVLNSNAEVEFNYSAGTFTSDLLNSGSHTVTLSIPDAEPIIIKIFVIKDFIDFSGDVSGITNRAFSTDVAPVVGDPQPNTIEAWVYIPEMILGSGTKASELGYIMGTGYGGSGPNIFSIAIYGTGAWGLFWNNKIYPTISIPSASTNPSTSTVPELYIPYDQWTHIATVRDKDAAVIHFYMNGELIHTTPTDSNLGNDLDFTSSKTIGIGKDGRTAINRRFGGSIATVAVFGTVLTQENIKDHMAGALSGSWETAENRWMYYDFSTQSMSFSHPASIEVISGVSASVAANTAKEKAIIKDLLGRNITDVTVTIDPLLVEGGNLIQGSGLVTFVAKDLFGNEETWTVEIEVTTPIPLLIYEGLETLAYVAGESKATIETYINSKIDVVNYNGSVAFTYTNNTFTADLLNTGLYEITISIPGADPVVIELYGLDNYISFLGDRDQSTSNAYSTGIIPTEQPNTIEAWIYVPSNIENNLIGYVTGNGAGGSGSETVALAVYGNGAFSYFWKGSLYPSISSVASGAVPSVPELTVPKDTWTHIAVVRDKDAKVFRYYINAELIYTTVSVGDIGVDQNAQNTSGGKEYGIGKDGRTTLDRRLPGMLSTVAIFNVSRTQEEIKADMLASITQENMTKANNQLIYFANIYQVLHDDVAPTISFGEEAKFTTTVGEYNDDFLAFIEENLSITDNNTFSPAKYTIDYNGAINIFQQFVDAGVYDVIITVSDLGGNSATYTIELTVDSDIDPALLTLVEINQNNQTINVGSTLQLTVTTAPTTATETVLYSSSDDTIASISQAGLVTALKNGVVIITAKNTDGTIADTIVITVVTPVIPLVSITIVEEDQDLEVYKTLQLTAIALPENATNASIIWETSNASVAVVSSTGLVTGVSEGTVTITAKNGDGSISDTITVTIITSEVPAEEGCAFACSDANFGAVLRALLSLSTLLGLAVIFLRRKF